MVNCDAPNADDPVVPDGDLEAAPIGAQDTGRPHPSIDV